METNHFFEFLQTRLKHCNLSALANDLDIPKALLHDWVQARRSPSLKNIKHVKKIADYLGVSLEYLLTGSGLIDELITSVKFEDGGNHYNITITKTKKSEV